MSKYTLQNIIVFVNNITNTKKSRTKRRRATFIVETIDDNIVAKFKIKREKSRKNIRTIKISKKYNDDLVARAVARAIKKIKRS